MALPMAVVVGACGGGDDAGPGAGQDPDGNLDEVTPGTPNVPSNSTNAPMISFDYGESSGDVMNPERGMYVGYNILNPSAAAAVRAGGHTIALAKVRLDNYRTSDIPASFLAQLDTEAIPPTAQVIELDNPLRDDVVTPSLPPGAALANAPATQGDHIAVPPILGGSTG